MFSRFLWMMLGIFVLASCGPLGTGSDGAAARNCPSTADFLTNIRNNADWLRGECHDITTYLQDPVLTAVTREFGNSIIKAKNLPFKSEVATAAHKPWSSWWYPKKDNDLFVGEDSTFAKYDILRAKYHQAVGRPQAGSARTYEQNLYNPRALAWEGLCDAWALAAVVKPEPKKPVALKIGSTKMSFSVADLKALLLKTFEAVDDSNLKYYGQKFTGAANGWIYPDVFPEQFHRFVEVQLFEKKQPFVMDHDPGLEVWNVPVFKANYLVEKVPNEPNAVFIRMWLYTAEPTLASEKDFVGTREAVREYNYVLQGERNASGDLTVTSGYWVKGPGGDSRKNHPDYFIAIPKPREIVRKSWNPEIDVNIIDEILEKSYE